MIKIDREGKQVSALVTGSASKILAVAAMFTEDAIDGSHYAIKVYQHMLFRWTMLKDSEISNEFWFGELVDLISETHNNCPEDDYDIDEYIQEDKWIGEDSDHETWDINVHREYPNMYMVQKLMENINGQMDLPF